MPISYEFGGFLSVNNLSYSYTMDCTPVRGDNPRALASGLSYVQVDKHGITILYHLHQCGPSHHKILCAKVGKGGIIHIITAPKEISNS